MKLKPLFTMLSTCFVLAASAQVKPPTPAGPGGMPATDSSKTKKPVGITDKIKTSKKIPGMFTLYQDTATGSVQLYVGYIMVVTVVILIWSTGW